jgi:excinuclease UvrABC helicase subunit UvrB
VDARPVAVIIAEKEKEMREAAADLQFELAALLRDEIKILQKTTAPVEKTSGRMSRGKRGRRKA